MDTDEPGSLSESLNKTDTLYFTVTAFATAGSEVISPSRSWRGSWSPFY
jgi:hypothetical protein